MVADGLAPSPELSSFGAGVEPVDGLFPHVAMDSARAKCPVSTPPVYSREDICLSEYLTLHAPFTLLNATGCRQAAGIKGHQG